MLTSCGALLAAPFAAYWKNRVGIENHAAYTRQLAAEIFKTWRDTTAQPIRYVASNGVITYSGTFYIGSHPLPMPSPRGPGCGGTRQRRWRDLASRLFVRFWIRFVWRRGIVWKRALPWLAASTSSSCPIGWDVQVRREATRSMLCCPVRNKPRRLRPAPAGLPCARPHRSQMTAAPFAGIHVDKAVPPGGAAQPWSQRLKRSWTPKSASPALVRRPSSR
jgi:hypothetical protein